MGLSLLNKRYKVEKMGKTQGDSGQDFILGKGVRIKQSGWANGDGQWQ